jgi:hypothetical protein
MKTIARILPILTIVAALTGCSSQQSETPTATEPGADTSTATSSGGQTPAPGPSEAWVLVQKGDAIGEQTVYLNSVGCRVENEPMDIKFVVAGEATKPDVAIWSDKKKLIYRNTLAGLEMERLKQQEAGDRIAKKFGATKEQTPFTAGKQDKIAGMPATEYVQVTKAKNPMDGTVTKTTTSIWLTSEIHPPGGALQMMKTKMEGLPSDMMPLRLVIEGDGKKVVATDTVKVDKIPMPATAFNTPSGYRRVPSEIDVAMGEGAGRALSELQRNLVEGPVIPKGALQNPAMLNKMNKMRAGTVPPRPPAQ